MAETAQTMTEFTYAPGEKNIVGDRFSPSVIDSNALVAIVCLLVAVANFANVMSATLTFHDPSGGANAITVSILEKDKLMSLAQEIQTRVFTDADQLRHEESMHMAEKQYTAQTNSVLIQQQMLANQQAQAEQTQPGE